jgi:ubiquinone/menaquinone biosynthesis C-methylase UbiE
MDINKKSLEIAHELYRNVEFEEASVMKIPFEENIFDLVFTAGLLIHIPPKDIKKAMEEIIRVSKRYVLAIEYYANKERERPFLGEMGITWERPYNDRYAEQGF